LATSAVTALGLAISAGPAAAASFLLKEQSVTGLGRAFAGSSAMGEDAATIFHNPAAMTRLQGPEVSAGAYLLIPRADLDNRGSTLTRTTAQGPRTDLVSGGDSDDPTDPTPLANAYVAYSLLNRDLWVGLGVSTPFGLVTEYDPGWFGRYDSIKTDLLTINVAPSAAYRINDWISIGGGLDIQYADAELARAIPNPNLMGRDIRFTVEGDDWSLGYNVGILLEPIPATRIGVHYRSGIEHKLQGDARVDVRGTAPGSVDLDLPDIVSVGFAHDVTPRLTLMAEYNWYGWSSFEEIRVESSPGFGASIPQDYENTFAIAVGGQYKVDDAWTVRTGFQYDQTPTNDRFRTTAIPDGDRYWLSAGASYDLSERFTIDVAYTHVFVSETDIDVVTEPRPGFPVVNTRATSKGSVDILAAALRVKF
jgi:long-chain fatty acid transport protein